MQEYNYPSNSKPEYASILVPNVDNVRTDFLIDCIAKQMKVRYTLSLRFARVLSFGIKADCVSEIFRAGGNCIVCGRKCRSEIE